MPFPVILKDFVNLLYPALCASCEDVLQGEESLICLHCQSELPHTRFHTFSGNPMEKVFWGRVPVAHAAAYVYFHKGSHVQNVMHHIKYKGMKEAAQVLGRWYGQSLRGSPFAAADMLAPVPLHLQKMKTRGYNQSEWFGKGLSEGLGVPQNTTALIRQRYSETQTKKARYKRWENVKEVFAVHDAAAFENRHVILVDDVVTTGATLEACARQILDLNCNAKISVLTLAFAGGV